MDLKTATNTEKTTANDKLALAQGARNSVSEASSTDALNSALATATTNRDAINGAVAGAVEAHG